MVIEVFSAPDEPMTLCGILGRQPMRPVKSCTEHLAHVDAGIPMSMAVKAWDIKVDDKKAKAGFSATPPKPFSLED